MNRGIEVLQTFALPLGYVAMSRIGRLVLAGVLGFEPRNVGIRIRGLTAWQYPNIMFLSHFTSEAGNVGWVVGFEPTYTGATTQGLRPLDDTHR